MSNNQITNLIDEVISNTALDRNNNLSNYLKLIKIGMSIYYEDDNINTLFENINEKNFKIAKNKLPLEQLENLTYKINYYYNTKYNKMPKNTFNNYYNILQTEEIIKIILKLADTIDEINIINIFDQINISNITEYKYLNNQIEVNLLRPLYELTKNNCEKISKKQIKQINSFFNQISKTDNEFNKAEKYRNIRELINQMCLEIKNMN